ncbi:hypothetical protein WJX77_000544 [Trebouxia sp. C0004]
MHPTKYVIKPFFPEQVERLYPQKPAHVVRFCRFQSKFKHLWDAAERSVRSADGPMGLMAIAPLETPQEPHPRPLEQALLASPGEVHSRTATGQREMLQSEKSGVQASKGSIVAAQSMQK